MATEKVKKARVIFGGTYGKNGDVVELPESQVKAGVASGDLDDTPAAVAYALEAAAAKTTQGEEKPLEA